MHAAFGIVRTPVGVLALFLLASFLLLRASKFSWNSSSRWFLPIALVLGTVAVVGPAAVLFGHLTYGPIAALSIAEAHGQPLYHAAFAAERYSLLYGPVAFWAYLPPILFGSDLRFFQLWVTVPILLTCFVLWQFSRKSHNELSQALVLLQAATSLLIFSQSLWAVRADVFLLCFAAIQLAAAVFLDGYTAILLMAVCGATLIDTKFSTVLLALLPPVIYYTRTCRVGPAITSVVLSLLLAVSAFLVPGVSLQNYLHWIAVAGHHGFIADLMLANILTFAFLTLPPAILLAALFCRSSASARTLLRRSFPILIVASTAVLSTIITGSKRGAGPWHCQPFLPLFVLASAVLFRELEETANRTSRQMPHVILQALGVSLTLLGIKQVVADISLFRNRLGEGASVSSAGIAGDLRQILLRYPNKEIQMGFGSSWSYPMTWQRTILLGAGKHYSIDADSLADMDLSGEPIPPATIESLRTCATNIWLIPKGDRPFSITSFYDEPGSPAPKHIFSPEFQKVFFENYALWGTTRYFDMWTCLHRKT